jgi:hypothetical protein
MTGTGEVFFLWYEIFPSIQLEMRGPTARKMSEKSDGQISAQEGGQGSYRKLYVHETTST